MILGGLLVGAGASFLLGGFAGCGLMAIRHSRRLGRIEGEHRAALVSLTKRVSDYAQYDLGTPREQATGDLLRDLYARIGDIDSNQR